MRKIEISFSFFFNVYYPEKNIVFDGLGKSSWGRNFILSLSSTYSITTKLLQLNLIGTHLIVFVFFFFKKNKEIK
jgi:hypothetical protein